MNPQPTQTPRSIGNYEIIKRLAVGGMGEIFLARQVGIGGFERFVIVKTMLQTAAPDRQTIDQFFDEARLAATLNHPNIVSIFELSCHGDTYFIAMEYIHGIDLHGLNKLLRTSGVAVPPRIGAALIRYTAVALDYAHKATDIRGRPMTIVHRDVSPQNIMVRLDGGVKVVDFGIARAASRFVRTEANVIKGKLLYMSPEQVRGSELTAGSDQFSLGVVAWEVFAREQLFRGDSAADVMRRIVSAPIAPLGDVYPGFPAELAGIVQRMLQREPADRFGSCLEVATALQAFLDRTGGSAEAELAAFVREHAGAAIAARAEHCAEDAAGGAGDEAGTLVTCPRCAHGNRVGASFCSRCGNSLQLAAATMAPAPVEQLLSGPHTGSALMPSLNLAEISGRYARIEIDADTATVPDLRATGMTPGAVVVHEAGQNFVDFGDSVESGVLELADDGASAIGPREPVFYGRRAELDLLEQMLAAAQQRRLRCAVVVGAEGSGKSRLLQKLALTADRQGFAVVHALSLRRGVALALDLFRQWTIALGGALTDKRLRSGKDLPATVQEALADVPREVIPLPLQRRLIQLFDAEALAVVGQPLEHGQRQLSGLMRFLQRVSERLPLLLLAEDIHGADPLSIDLLHMLVERLPEARLCVVASALNAGSLANRRGIDVVPLTPFGPDELQVIAQNTSVAGDLPAGIKPQLVAAQGCVTVAVQLARSRTSLGPVERVPGLARTAPALPVLETVSDCVAAILQQLPAGAREVVCAAAVVGEVFPVALLDAVCAAAGCGPATAIDDALAVGLVKPHVPSRAALRFAQGSFRRHLLAVPELAKAQRLRAALLATLPLSTALPRHEAVETLTLQLVGSDQADRRIIALFAAAARDLITRGLVGPALEHLGRALELGPRMLDAERPLTEESAALLLRVGSDLGACLLQVDAARGSALLVRLLDRLPPHLAPRERMMVSLRLAHCLLAADRPQQAAAALDSGLHGANQSRFPDLWATIEAEKALLLRASGGLPESIFMLGEALEKLGRIPVSDAAALAERCEQLGRYYCELARSYQAAGRSDIALESVRRAQEIAKYAGQPQAEVRALLCGVELADDDATASAMVGAALLVAEQQDDPTLLTDVYMARFRAEAKTDRQGAARFLQQAQQAARLVGRHDIAGAAIVAGGALQP